jgi:hypothetical protein
MATLRVRGYAYGHRRQGVQLRLKPGLLRKGHTNKSAITEEPNMIGKTTS